MNRLIRHLPLLLFVATTVAEGSEQSERLYSRGLADFHAQRYAQALQLFDQAVQADPRDVSALYYRGVTHGRLNDFTAAVTDLRAVTRLKPDFDYAALELGVALVESGQYQDASRWLEQAQRVPELEAQASLFLGLAQLRLDQLAAAGQNFARAARDESVRLPAHYYEGVIAYRQGDSARAKERFSSVVSAGPDSAMGKEAAAFLDKLQQAQQLSYHVYGEVGFQYDSNVVLAPSGEQLKAQAGISKQQDGRAILTAGAGVVPWQSQRVQLSLGYEFFQSLHFDLSDFNLQDQRAAAQVVADLDVVKVGLLGHYDFYLLKDDSFLQEANALPWVTIPETNWGRTEVFYRMRRRDFLKQPFSGLRDAFNHAPGIRQYVYVDSPARFLSVGYQFDREEPVTARGDVFAYDGNEINGGVGWSFPLKISTEATYAYRHERYAPPSHGRRDDVHEIIFAVDKSLSDHFDLRLAYFGTLNRSSDLNFDYERHIASLSLGVRF